MGRHDIGDYFKERMKGQHLDIDTDAVWNELGLEKKRKRRGLWWIWGLGSLVLIAGAYLAYEMTVTIGGDSREKQAELLASPNEASEDTYQPNKEKHISNATESKIKTERTTQRETELDIPPSQPTLNKIKPEINQAQSNSPQAKSRNTISFYERKEVISAPDTTPRRAHSQDHMKINATEQGNETPIKKEEQKLLASLTGLDLIKYDLQHSRKFTLPTLSTLKPLAETSVRRPSRKKKANLDFHLYIGGFFIDRKLTTSRPEIQALLDSRSATERGLESIVVGSDFSLVFDSGLKLGLGVEQQYINEVFSTSSVSVDTTLISTVIVPTYEVRSRTESNRHYNRHTLTHIPVHLGYEMDLDKWRVGVTGTVLMTVQSPFSGSHFDSAGEVSEITGLYNEGFRLGYRLAMNLTRKLSDRWVVHLDPTYQLQGSFVRPEAGYEQSYGLMGVVGGLKYRLSR